MDKQRLVRDIEYVNGGIHALSSLMNLDRDYERRYVGLFEEWNNILDNVATQLSRENEELSVEDEENA